MWYMMSDNASLNRYAFWLLQQTPATVSETGPIRPAEEAAGKPESTSRPLSFRALTSLCTIVSIDWHGGKCYVC